MARSDRLASTVRSRVTTVLCYYTMCWNYGIIEAMNIITSNDKYI